MLVLALVAVAVFVFVFVFVSVFIFVFVARWSCTSSASLSSLGSSGVASNVAGFDCAGGLPPWLRKGEVWLGGTSGERAGGGIEARLRDCFDWFGGGLVVLGWDWEACDMDCGRLKTAECGGELAPR